MLDVVGQERVVGRIGAEAVAHTGGGSLAQRRVGYRIITWRRQRLGIDAIDLRIKAADDPLEGAVIVRRQPDFLRPGFEVGGIDEVRRQQHARIGEAEVDRYRSGERARIAADEDVLPVLIDVYAPWCTVCARQQPLIESAAKDPANKDLIIFKLDFDKQKAEQRQFRVTKQSTLIAFDGKRETGRLLGSTDAKSIASLLASTRG